MSQTLRDLKYELPSLVKGLQESWVATLTSSAVISGLFAGIQSQFLSGTLALAQTLAQDGQPVLGQTLIVFFYITFFLNVSATISSMVLIDEFGDLQIRAAGSSIHPVDTSDESARQLLTRHNKGRKLWKWVMWHWLFSLAIGVLSFVVQLAIYACVNGVYNANVACIVILSIFTILPLVHLLPLESMFNEASTNTADQGESEDKPPARGQYERVFS